MVSLSNQSKIEIFDILKRYWGYDSFRPLQQEIIESVLHGDDTLALLPTGGGKSLCYQVPALAMEGMCLVVSPLIALMKDQVRQLKERKIAAEYLASDISMREQYTLMEKCIGGGVKLLYVTPERLRQTIFRNHLRQMKVALIAVDEAHCISQWGYDFRPPYLQIAQIRELKPEAPVLALTATATPVVADDICRQLLFRPGQKRFQSSFLRPNIAYMVFKESDKMGRLLRIVRTVGGCGIVYVRNRRMTREVAQFLTSNGVPAAYYHAGLGFKERDLSQRQWTKGEIPVMVATNAFGMGIDKADVRFIVHLDIPDTMEAYFQEAGRAGRDGEKAYAVLLYDDGDMVKLDQSFEISYPPQQQIANMYRALCNYYQIPVGSGEGCSFDFDIEAVCNTYKLNVLEFYSALRLLEREGLIRLSEPDDSRSTLFVCVGRQDMYRFQVENRRYGDLMTVVLRMYGGLFTAPVRISEREIARKIFIEEEQIEKMLLQVDAMKIVEYSPRHKRPWIEFTSSRVDAKDLYLNKIDYPQLQLRAKERMEAMKRYVTAEEGCRSVALVGYFGEEGALPCGVCDHCLKGKKEAPLRQKILEALREKPMRSDELQQVLQVVDEKAFLGELQALVEEHKVSIDERFQFVV